MSVPAPDSQSRRLQLAKQLNIHNLVLKQSIYQKEKIFSLNHIEQYGYFNEFPIETARFVLLHRPGRSFRVERCLHHLIAVYCPSQQPSLRFRMMPLLLARFFAMCVASLTATHDILAGKQEPGHTGADIVDTAVTVFLGIEGQS